MTDPTAQFTPNYDRPVRRPDDELGPFQPGDRVTGSSFTTPTWDDATVVTGQPSHYAAHPVYPPRPPVDISWITTPFADPQIEQARELRRHKRRRSSVVPIVLVVLGAILAGLIPVAVIMYSRDHIPFMQDSGITGCKALAAADAASPSPSVKSSKASFEQSADDAKALAKFRKLFADSRYADLREAGTKMMDITAQVVADPDSALLAIGAFYGAYASLAGACGAHGVPLPPISS
jgi:hypothetical protein